jgi:hypothetical protein
MEEAIDALDDAIDSLEKSVEYINKAIWYIRFITPIYIPRIYKVKWVIIKVAVYLIIVYYHTKWEVCYEKQRNINTY